MKKGFTLVELLAVIVILGLVATIAVPSAFSISYNIKKNMYCEKVDLLLQDAKRWANEHQSRFKTNCYTEITVDYLVENGITKKENDTEGSYIINPVNNEAMDNKVIGIYLKNKRAYAFYVETDEELINACETSRVCEPGEVNTDEENPTCIERPQSKC